MTNEMKLLTAFIKAQGFGIERTVDYQERIENTLCLLHLSGRCVKSGSIDGDTYVSVLIDPIVDYKLYRVKPTKEEVGAEVVVNDGTKLVPCPFCCSESANLIQFMRYEYQCNGCGAKSPHGRGIIKATSLWNKRANGDKGSPHIYGFDPGKAGEDRYTVNLVPCPSCHKTNNLTIRYKNPGREVTCFPCRLSVNFTTSDEKVAIELWNTMFGDKKDPD